MSILSVIIFISSFILGIGVGFILSHFLKNSRNIEFQNMSNRMSKDLQNTSKETLLSTIEPLKEKLNQFNKEIRDYYDNQNKSHSSLEGQIKNMSELNRQITKETSQLTEALKGQSHTQGAWGEMILNRILESSGLTEGREYELQGKGMSLKSDSGGLLKPDAVVFLPENRHLVIDSKVSLTDYLKWIESKDENIKESHFKNFIKSFKTHIKELSEKNYIAADGLNSVGFTFLFFPIESAFSLILAHDINFFEEAWKKSIIIVSPTSLLASLKTVYFLWQGEKAGQNAKEIADKSGAIYDKFVNFLVDLEKVEKSFGSSQQHLEVAMKKLHSGKGNIISKLEEVKSLGAKTSKSIDPKSIASHSLDHSSNDTQEASSK